MKRRNIIIVIVLTIFLLIPSNGLSQEVVADMSFSGKVVLLNPESTLSAFDGKALLVNEDKEEILSIYGEPTKNHFSEGRLMVYYIAPFNYFLEEYNMPLYSEVFVFEDNHLVSMEFGFDLMGKGLYSPQSIIPFEIFTILMKSYVKE